MPLPPLLPLRRRRPPPHFHSSHFQREHCCELSYQRPSSSSSSSSSSHHHHHHHDLLLHAPDSEMEFNATCLLHDNTILECVHMLSGLHIKRGVSWGSASSDDKERWDLLSCDFDFYSMAVLLPLQPQQQRRR